MRFRIDLKIFILLLLFYLTKQIHIYAMIMVFAMIHEIGHLMAGLMLGMKPEKIEIKPFGFSISFKLTTKDYNKKVKKANLLEIKKIIVALAGPITNLIIIIMTLNIVKNLWQALIIIYTNMLIILFNILPIYPLDGGRILKGILHIFLGRKKAIQYTNTISFTTAIILTLIASIAIFYLENIAIFFAIIYLWFLVIKQDKNTQNIKRIYEMIEKSKQGIENKIN